MTDSPIDPTQVQRLADVAVRTGLNLQPGQELVLTAPIDAAPLVRAVAAAAYEAGAIEGLVASSPITAWLYNVFSLQGASNLIGTIEIAVAALIAIGFVHKRSAIIGAVGAIVTFLVTLSFLFTAPGWEASLGGFPALSVVPGQFLLKDVVLLTAAFFLLGKALSRES
mgnify:CR=1 FL=1